MIATTAHAAHAARLAVLVAKHSKHHHHKAQVVHTAQLTANVFTSNSVIAGSLVLALCLCGLVGVSMWKDTLPRFTSVLAVIAGLCVGGTVFGIALRFIPSTKAAAIVAVVALVLMCIAGYTWLHEVTGHGYGRFRTPIVGALFGILLIGVAGSATSAIIHSVGITAPPPQVTSHEGNAH